MNIYGLNLTTGKHCYQVINTFKWICVLLRRTTITYVGVENKQRLECVDFQLQKILEANVDLCAYPASVGPSILPDILSINLARLPMRHHVLCGHWIQPRVKPTHYLASCKSAQCWNPTYHTQADSRSTSATVSQFW